MAKTNTRQKARLRRKKHIRKIVVGTTDRPRLCVFRSAKHIYAQIIDDSTGVTLASESTISQNLRTKISNGGNKEAAKLVGEALSVQAKEKGISSVVFDRNGFLYHGRVKALAEAVRSGGLKF